MLSVAVGVTQNLFPGRPSADQVEHLERDNGEVGVPHAAGRAHLPHVLRQRHGRRTTQGLRPRLQIHDDSQRHPHAGNSRNKLPALQRSVIAESCVTVHCRAELPRSEINGISSFTYRLYTMCCEYMYDTWLVTSFSVVDNSITLTPVGDHAFKLTRHHRNVDATKYFSSNRVY